MIDLEHGHGELEGQDGVEADHRVQEEERAGRSRGEQRPDTPKRLCVCVVDIVACIG